MQIVRGEAEPPQATRELGRRGEWVAAGRAETGEVGEVVVEVDVDRAGNVAGRVGRATGARPVEVPAHVGHAHVRLAKSRCKFVDADHDSWPASMRRSCPARPVRAGA